MITATEAKELVKCSDVMVQRYLEALDPAIRSAAESGRTFLVTSSVSTTINGSHDVLSVHMPSRKMPEMTELQKRLIDALKKFGFAAQFERHGDPYVPPGLDSGYDDDTGPRYQHWTMIVSRDLKTGSKFDQDFIPGRELYMWVAVFDHTQTRHTRHTRPVRLVVQD